MQLQTTQPGPVQEQEQGLERTTASRRTSRPRLHRHQHGLPWRQTRQRWSAPPTWPHRWDEGARLAAGTNVCIAYATVSVQVLRPGYLYLNRCTSLARSDGCTISSSRACEHSMDFSRLSSQRKACTPAR